MSDEHHNDHMAMELLYIERNEKEQRQPELGHYVCIKDFNRKMFNFTKRKCSKHFCMHCLHCFHCFYFIEHLKRHQKDCFQINRTQAIEMPAEGSKIYFKNHHKMSSVLVVIYVDFEAEKVDTTYHDLPES